MSIECKSSRIRGLNESYVEDYKFRLIQAVFDRRNL